MPSDKNTEPVAAGVRVSLTRRLAIVAAVGLAAIAMAVVATGGDDAQQTTSVPPGPSAGAQELGADAAHQPPAHTRTLAVHTRKAPAPSADPVRMRGKLLDGTLPVASSRPPCSPTRTASRTPRACRTAATSFGCPAAGR
jgi:hypothetical protein